MLLSINVRRKFISALLFSGLFFTSIQEGIAQKTFGLLKKINGNDENGYVLFTPMNCDTTYLINKCGKRVHHWVSPHPPGMSAYLLPNGHLLKSGTEVDTSFGLAGGRGGIIEEFDWDNKLVWRYKIFNDSLCQHHDIRPMPNGNVLVLTWHAISKSQAIALGRKSQSFASSQTDLWGERLVELKPIGKDSAELVWQWDVFDHIIQDGDTSLPNYGVIEEHPELVNINYALTLQTNDWLHANGIDYNEQLDQIVLSIHNMSEIWIIDHSTTMAEAATHRGGVFDKGGDLLYRWGNPQAYGKGSSFDRKLFRQHNAHWIKNGLQDSGCIMVFNNGWDRDTAYSTIEVIQTPIFSNGSYNQNLPYGPAKAKWIYKDSIPKNFYSQIISGAERMPNGNTLVCSGVQGIFFEVTPKGKTVWKYKNPVYGSGVRNDGGTGFNQVFRCSFYPSNYQAFVGKALNAGAALERNSMAYSCNYESVTPTVLSVAPFNNSNDIAVDSNLVIKMSEAVLQTNASIVLFANGMPFETIGTSSDLVKYLGDEIRISHFKKFPYNSRISVKVPVKFARDSSFNFTNKAIDTSVWHFETRRQAPLITFLSPDSGSLHVDVNVKPYMLFDQVVHKLDSGGIDIFEDGLLMEHIPIGSSKIKISGNVLEILDTKFNYEKTVSIVIDSCIADVYGGKIKPLDFGRWVFNTKSRPRLEALSPSMNSVKVGVYTTLIMTFDRNMSIDSNKKINIYSNGSLFESINLNSNELEMKGTEFNIALNFGLPGNSRIAVEIPENALIDNYGMHFEGLDSSAWVFFTDIKSSVENNTIGAVTVYPNPAGNVLRVNSQEELISLQLVDQLGRVVELVFERISESEYSVDVSKLKEGIYAVIVNGVVEMRLIKIGG